MVSSGRHAIACILLILGVAICSHAQTTPAKEPTASITGKVTMKGKGVPGITVFVTDPRGYSRPSYRGVTDASGNYRISNIPEGTYRVSPHAAFAVENREATNPVNVADGETIEDMDFVLVKGAVITGKVTDYDGQPVIEQMVTLQLQSVDDYRGMTISHFPVHTDDRGIYRAFGLRQGKYKVSAGQGYERLPVPGRGGHTYAQTFHPSTTDEAKALLIEVSEGSEAKDVDIVMVGRAPGGFKVSGRIVHGETGKALPNIVYGITQHHDGGSSSTSGARSNADGEFKFDNVLPGKYSVFTHAERNGEFRANPLRFEVTDHDITGLVLKTVRGASLSGVVVIESSDEKSASKKLSELHINAMIENSDGHDSHGATAVAVKPDGSFTINGLRSGTAHIHVNSMSSYGSRDLSVARVERDGIVQPSGINIKEGEQIQGLRLLVKHLTGAIRGQIKVEGGELPASATVYVSIALVNEDPNRSYRTEQTDARRRFLAQGLAAGRYEVMANVYLPGRMLNPDDSKQEVTVIDNAVSEVVLTVKLKNDQ